MKNAISRTSEDSCFSSLVRLFRVAAMKRLLLLTLSVVAGCARLSPNAGMRPEDAAFHQVAEDYVSGYLAWRPQTGTALGFHQYDGKVTDFSRASLEAELARLHKFDEQLGALKTN